MRVKIWGARGSTGTPERRNSRYGGNTPCVEIRLENGTLIVLDCGSGLRSLGMSLLREFAERPIQGHIFLSHFHWDHIQGIPFFLPLYKKGNTFHFHAAGRSVREIRSAIEGQMMPPYFPVKMDMMQATHHFHDLDFRPINVNGAMITARPLCHPQGCVGYRVEADGMVFVYATDTEPGSAPHDRAVRELASDADVLLYDSQYTPEQLQGERKGWGHSSWREAVRIARECWVGHLLLFHHDPDSNDAFIDSLVEQARHEYPYVNAAAEGMIFRLSEGAIERDRELPAQDRRQGRRLHVEFPIRVKWRDADGWRLVTEGLTRDLSPGGIYFFSPQELRPIDPIELNLLVPGQTILHGTSSMCYQAELVRSEHLNGGLVGVYPPKIGVAARFLKDRSTGRFADSGN